MNAARDLAGMAVGPQTRTDGCRWAVLLYLVLCPCASAIEVQAGSHMLSKGLELIWQPGSAGTDYIRFQLIRTGHIECGWMGLGWAESAKMIGANAIIWALWLNRTTGTASTTVPEIRWFTINLKNTQLSDDGQDKARNVVRESFTQTSEVCTLSFEEPYADIMPFMSAGSLNVVWALGASQVPDWHGKGGRGSARIDIARTRGGFLPHWAFGLIGALAASLIAAAWCRQRGRDGCGSFFRSPGAGSGPKDTAAPTGEKLCSLGKPCSYTPCPDSCITA